MKRTQRYKKHYPPAHPDYQVTGARPTFTRGFLYVLRRAHGRYARWLRQAGRRRPELLRPLTVGEKTVRHCLALSRELTALLLPFRRTRPRGHEELRGLLADADTCQDVVAQVLALRACVNRLSPEHLQLDRQVATWRQEWEGRASEARRHELTHVHKAQVINAHAKGLAMLLAEARLDLQYIELLAPTAFAPPPAPEPWLDSTRSASPPPYSA